MTEDIEIFKLLADLKQFKVDIYFANFGQVRIDPICFLYWIWTGPSYSTSLGKLCSEKQSKASPFDKIQEPGLRSGISYFQWFNQWESRTGFLSQ